MSECKGCGTELKNCGAPIWEDYCPNKECHYEAEQFKARLRKAGEDARKKKNLEAAAPDMYEALEALFNSYKDLADSGDAGFWKIEDQQEGKQALAALAKARGEV